MKISVASAAFALTAAAIVVAQPTISSAAVLAYDGINYTSGVSIAGQNGGTGFSGPWGVSSASFGYLYAVRDNSITYPNQSTPTGNFLNFAAGFGGPGTNAAARNFSATYGTAGSDVWGSATYTTPANNSTPPPNFDFALTNNGANAVVVPLYGAGYTGPTTVRSTGSAGPGNFLLYEATGTNVNVYINPNLSTFDPATATPTYTFAGAPFNGFRFDISNVGNGDQAGIDEIRLGNTLQDVANVASAVPEPASLSLLGLGAIGLLRRRKN